MTYADYAGDLALLSNTTVQTESLLHSLEQVTGDSGLYVNANETKFKTHKGAISTLIGKPLKLIDQFTYLDISISSTESYINIRIS